jgi:copper resistance protein B
VGRNAAQLGRVRVQGLRPTSSRSRNGIGEGGETAATVEVEYEMLFTNRLIANWGSKPIGSGRPIGGSHRAGLTTVAGRVRARSEITRQFPPHLGFEREWRFGKTSDLRGLSSHSRTDNRWVIGLRFWF